MVQLHIHVEKFVSKALRIRRNKMNDNVQEDVTLKCSVLIEVARKSTASIPIYRVSKALFEC